MTKIAADTIDEFVQKANQKFGGGKLGNTQVTPPEYTFQFKDGKLTKVKFGKLDIDMDSAEPGSGKPPDGDKAAIQKAADMSKKHEETHKKDSEDAYKKWDPDKATKDLMSKTFKDKAAAEKAIKDKIAELMQAVKNACLDLHKKEGNIVIKKNPNGSVDVSMKPEGAGGCG